MKRKYTHRIPLIEKFEKKIFYSPCGCWYWISKVANHGYGVFWIGKHVLAHRAAYRFYKGEIPDGLLVCHSCDNPICVNPDHLFLGTHKDNIADMDTKGRGVHALSFPENRKAKFNEVEKDTIRQFSKSGLSASKIARDFNVSVQLICQIIKSKNKVLTKTI